MPDSPEREQDCCDPNYVGDVACYNVVEYMCEARDQGYIPDVDISAPSQ